MAYGMILSPRLLGHSSSHSDRLFLLMVYPMCSFVRVVDVVRAMGAIVGRYVVETRERCLTRYTVKTCSTLLYLRSNQRVVQFAQQRPG
jgi:hypothetical protein